MGRSVYLETLGGFKFQANTKVGEEVIFCKTSLEVINSKIHIIVYYLFRIYKIKFISFEPFRLAGPPKTGRYLTSKIYSDMLLTYAEGSVPIPYEEIRMFRIIPTTTMTI